MGKRAEITGERFGALTVLSYAGWEKKHALWRCRCDCGNISTVRLNNLRNGHTQSCGCQGANATIGVRSRTHGHTPVGEATATYRTWQRMKCRCYNTHHDRYELYGGRGIRVCDRWRNSFENFLSDMGERPEGHSLDRINPNGNYEPSNCRWATHQEQMRNTRVSVMVTYQGKRLSMRDAAELAGIPHDRAYLRKKRGWPEDRWFE